MYITLLCKQLILLLPASQLKSAVGPCGVGISGGPVRDALEQDFCTHVVYKLQGNFSRP